MQISKSNIFDKIDEKEFIVVDDFLPSNQADEIDKFLTTTGEEWKFNVSTSQKYDYDEQRKYDDNCKEYLQFGKNFITYEPVSGKTTAIDNMEQLTKVMWVVDEFGKKFSLDEIKIFRAKANLLTQYQNNKKEYYDTPHVDWHFPHHVLLYYVNDSDGDTVLFKNRKVWKRISPKKNRLVMFNHKMLHASSHPIESIARVVLNYNIQKV